MYLWDRVINLSGTGPRFKDVTDERSYGIKRRCRKPKYAKEQNYNRVRVFENWCDENGLEKKRPEWLDKVLERFFPCVCKQDGTNHDCERNLSSMISKGNRMVYS